MPIYNVSDPEIDGGILGNPVGYRYATNRRNLNMRGVGECMLRGEYKPPDLSEGNEQE